MKIRKQELALVLKKIMPKKLTETRFSLVLFLYTKRFYDLVFSFIISQLRIQFEIILKVYINYIVFKHYYEFF